jgi:hypothetical protein
VIAYLITDRALGTGGSHFVSVDFYLHIHVDGRSNAVMKSRRPCCPPMTFELSGAVHVMLVLLSHREGIGSMVQDRTL